MDADRQIDQMIQFIKQEAQEKAEEIRVRTDKEFMAEKLQHETQASIAVRAEAEKQRKQYEIQQRIEKSKHLTQYRFALMKRRDNHMQHARTLTLNKLRDVSKDKQKYSELLKYLIAQGLQTILEKEVTLQVRKEDLDLVRKAIPQGISLYQDVMKQASGITPKVDVKIDEQHFLPPGPKSDDDKQLTCTGGIVLTAKNGQIVCKNTLDARLDIAFDRMKPQIRGIIWGERARIVAKEVKKSGGVSLPK